MDKMLRLRLSFSHKDVIFQYDPTLPFFRSSASGVLSLLNLLLGRRDLISVQNLHGLVLLCVQPRQQDRFPHAACTQAAVAHMSCYTRKMMLASCFLCLKYLYDGSAHCCFCVGQVQSGSLNQQTHAPCSLPPTLSHPALPARAPFFPGLLLSFV